MKIGLEPHYEWWYGLYWKHRLSLRDKYFP